ncbi:MAG TPA: hypothetical protein VFV75_14220 [Candidatus Polarisedimenticolaceae bacterium]|nr:hypothetical protein [Candidatus Polarisedimenticolaceae bacterium]
MVLFNYSTKELTAKIVYYGPGLCGKTTNLQYIHGNLPDQVKGKMLSLATKTDRTLFFDFLPIDLGDIRGMKTRVQLYTVPGQVFYNETRKLVLKGADGIVFVADSQEAMLNANLESFKNLEENLKGHALRLADMPHVIQFNKRDLPRLSSIEELNSALNRYNAPFYESVATTGIGVQDTLKAIVKLVLLHLTRKYDPKTAPEKAAAPSRIATPVVTSAAPPPPPAPPAPRAAAVRAIPLSSISSMEAEPVPVPPARPARPVHPVAAQVVPPAETDFSFDASEVDVLVDEVREAPPAWQPHEAAAAWQTDMGAPEGDPAEPWAAGGTPAVDVLEDLASPPAEETFQPLEAVPAATPEAWDPPAPEEPYALDRGFDPAWAPEPPPDLAPEPAPALPRPAAAEVLLTDVATGASLFADPDLEVARLTVGTAREVKIPVELTEGGQVRRFVLALTLTLTPAE